MTASLSHADMPAQSFDLTFNGYWREPNIAGIPSESGVYCAYICAFNEVQKTVDLQQLLYIGGSENAREAVARHELWQAWEAQKSAPDHQVCFNFAPANAEYLERIVAALVKAHHPSTNPPQKDFLPFETTTVSASGRSALIKPTITV